MPKVHEVSPENATRFKDWLANRGGIAIWKSINLSNPSGSWSTPALQLEPSELTGKCEPTTKPTWEAANEPERVIRDIADIVVVVPKEVKRFHIAIRLGSQGLTWKLTDGATRRVYAAVAKAGEGAWFELDHSTQEAVIFVPDRVVPLAEWKE